MTDPQTGETSPASAELGNLLAFLPNTWDYSMGFSGSARRIVLLYQTAVIEVHEVSAAGISDPAPGGGQTLRVRGLGRAVRVG